MLVFPNRIQLFHKGVELAIKIEGQQDGKFDPADYIEFYGVKNDGSSTQNYIPILIINLTLTTTYSLMYLLIF